jgi:hypothetical protein
MTVIIFYPGHDTILGHPIRICSRSTLYVAIANIRESTSRGRSLGKGGRIRAVPIHPPENIFADDYGSYGR